MEEKLLKKIESRLSVKPDTKYAIMVNNELIINGENRIVYCRYNREPKLKDRLEIGLIVTIDHKRRFKVSESCKKLVVKKLTNTTYGSARNQLNFEYFSDELDVVIEFNDDLKLINIKQNLFKVLFEKIYVQAERGKMVIGDGLELSDEDINSLYSGFDSDSVRNYSTLVERRIQPYLKRCNEFKFYYIFQAFQPMFIRGACIFNPFLDSKINKSIFEESNLYKIGTNHYETKADGSLSVMFITDRNISECLKFSEPIRCDVYFLTGLMGGFINNTLPRNDVYIYKSDIDGAPTLSMEAFTELPEFERAHYYAESTLFTWCNLMYRKTSEPNSSALYNVVKNSSIV